MTFDEVPRFATSHELERQPHGWRPYALTNQRTPEHASLGEHRCCTAHEHSFVEAKRPVAARIPEALHRVDAQVLRLAG